MAEAVICLPYEGKPSAHHRGALVIDLAHAPAMNRWTRADTVAVAVIVAGAAALRMVSLGRPVELVFDEIFYARNACWYLYASEPVCEIADQASRGHPPLGNWLVATGIAAFGYEPFGWRIGAAVAGTLGVGLLYLLAWRLLRGWTVGRGATVGAAAASGLLATDFLHLVQSRIAMLDVFLALFVIGAVLFIVLDRDRVRQRPASSWWWRLALGRPWRLLAGACLGAALGVKWSGLYIAPAVIGLVVAWEIAEQRRREPNAGWAGAVTGAIRHEALPTLVLLGIVPVLVYASGYIGRMPGELVALPWDPASVWRGIWEHQRAMLEFHTASGPAHPYQSPPWSWPLLKRPVAYWFSQDQGRYREILALGNPLTWWPGMLALAALGVAWWRRRLALGRPEPVILAAAVASYLPWLILAGSGQAFIWYFLPTVPFLCLALACLAGWAWSTVGGRAAVVAVAVVMMASVAFFLPVLTALPLEPDAWRMRMIFTDCERADGTDRELPDDTTSEGQPPTGWCWI
jgi:dolichyl-phosphate-mannose-protein mannosyltransferase